MSLKGDLVNRTFKKLRISGITLSPSAELVSDALEITESMMSELATRQMCLGYNFEDVPDAASEVGIDRGFENMVITNAAVRLASHYGKEIPTTLSFDANQAMNNVQGVLLSDSTRQIDYPARMPIGSGNQRITNQFYRYYGAPQTPPNNCDTKKIAIGEINDYVELYHAYLNGETINSFTTQISRGLVLETSSNTDDKVIYRIKAVSGAELGVLQQLLIIITTSTGRIESRVKDFELTKDEIAKTTV